MFSRKIEQKLKKAVAEFPVVVLTGPRQSGKTTLLRQLFPQLTYVSLENPDVLLLAKSDPKSFLEQHQSSKGLIIDEAQNLPELFSYIQGYVDLEGYPGMFILSGSQNFLLLEKVSQTLAGRSAILELLPLSYPEFTTDGDKKMPLWEYLYMGSYPRPYHEQLDRDLTWIRSKSNAPFLASSKKPFVKNASAASSTSSIFSFSWHTKFIIFTILFTIDG